MLEKFIKSLIIIFMVFLITGCASPARVINISSDEALVTISSIDPVDWSNVAQKSIDSLIASGALKRGDGEASIVMISRVRNYTLQHIDTQILTAKIRTAILNSGQGKVTNAIGNKNNTDIAIRRSRDFENDDLFNQATVQKRGTVIAPNMSISGAIVQQTATQGRKEESYFSFHITLTDLTTGVAVWEYNEDILKQGTHSIWSTN